VAPPTLPRDEVGETVYERGDETTLDKVDVKSVDVLIRDVVRPQEAALDLSEPTLPHI
jgi:hypothetical protein